MQNMLRTARWLALIFLCLEMPSWAALPYTVTDLGILPGFRSVGESGASAINELGQVAGKSRDVIYVGNIGTLTEHPSLWSPTTPNAMDGSLLDLATGDYAPPRQSFAKSINSYGQVVGESTFGSGSFLWTPTSPNGQTGTIIDLGDLPGGYNGGSAVDINSHGQVVGIGTVDTPAYLRPYLWSPTTPNASTGSMIDLGTLPDYSYYSYANGINSYGQVVGKSSSEDANRAFLWTPDSPNGETGSMVDLGALNDEYDGAEGIKINARGQVAGNAFASPELPVKAFLWTPDTPNGDVGSMIDLGHLPGGSGTSFAYGMNSTGQVVGACDVSGQQGIAFQKYHGFLWTPTTSDGTAGEMVDLNSLLDPADQTDWTILYAADINDRGQIAAIAYYDPDGRSGAAAATRGILLTPTVPEPSSLALTVLGAMIAAGALRCGVTRRRAF